MGLSLLPVSLFPLWISCVSGAGGGDFGSPMRLPGAWGRRCWKDRVGVQEWRRPETSSLFHNQAWGCSCDWVSPPRMSPEFQVIFRCSFLLLCSIAFTKEGLREGVFVGSCALGPEKRGRRIKPFFGVFYFCFMKYYKIHKRIINNITTHLPVKYPFT